MPTSSPRRLAPPPIAAARPIELRPRGDFVEWLAAAGGTLAVTTYNSGKLALLSASAGELVASYWSFPRPMGLAVAGRRLALASRDHFWQMEICDREESADASVSQRIIVPASSIRPVDSTPTTSRSIAAASLFANTRFNCVARPSERVHFKRVWRPSFMEATPPTMAVDCCHLNGIGVRAGRLEMATAFCEQAEPAAWRAVDRFQSGVLDRRPPRSRCRARALSPPLAALARRSLVAVRFGPRRPRDVRFPNVRFANRSIELPGFTRGLTFAGESGRRRALANSQASHPRRPAGARALAAASLGLVARRSGPRRGNRFARVRPRRPRGVRRRIHRRRHGCDVRRPDREMTR